MKNSLLPQFDRRTAATTTLSVTGLLIFIKKMRRTVRPTQVSESELKMLRVDVFATHPRQLPTQICTLPYTTESV